MKIRFGVQLWQEEFDFQAMKRAWREVEAMGYDSAWLYDHFYPMSHTTSSSIPEAWTLLPSLAAETERLRLGVLVTCNSYRYPSVLAKVAATVDGISGGRLEFGLGAGWHKEEHDAYGIPFPDAKTRMEQLAEAVEIIRRIWTEEKTTFRGRHYTISDLVSYPKPLQKPHPPIWIGGKGNMLLKVVAEHAQYANLGQCSVVEFREKLHVLSMHCTRLGRDYQRIGKTWHGWVILAEREEAKRKALQFKESSAIPSVRQAGSQDFIERNIIGTAEECTERIQEYADMGVTYFIPYFPFGRDLGPLRVFMDKVVLSLG